MFLAGAHRTVNAEPHGDPAGLADGDCRWFFWRLHDVFELRMGNGEDAGGWRVAAGFHLRGGECCGRIAAVRGWDSAGEQVLGAAHDAPEIRGRTNTDAHPHRRVGQVAWQAAVRSDRGAAAQGEIFWSDGAARGCGLRWLEHLSYGQNFAALAGPANHSGSRGIHGTHRGNSPTTGRNGGRRADHAGEGARHPVSGREEIECPQFPLQALVRRQKKYCRTLLRGRNARASLWRIKGERRGGPHMADLLAFRRAGTSEAVPSDGPAIPRSSMAITQVHLVLDVLAARDVHGEILTAVRHFPAREAQWADFPAWVHSDLAAAY